MVIKILLFAAVEVFWRPKALVNYSFKQKIRMTMDPFESGKNVIRHEDWNILKWYRFSWLIIYGLLFVRLILSTIVLIIGNIRADLL